LEIRKCSHIVKSQLTFEGAAMRLREWAGLVAFSVLLHVVIFWPLPAPSDGGGRVSPLIVSLPEVQSNVTPEVEPVFVEDRDPGFEDADQAVRQATKSHPKRASNRLAEVKPTMPSPLESDKEPIGAESKTSQLEEARDLSAAVSKEDLGPSLSRYRLAVAAEVIRMRASVEGLVAPDFQGKLVVLVQFRGLDAAPLVSLEETVGSDRLDREILVVFRRAANLVPVSIAGDVGDASVRLPVHFGMAALE